MKEAKPSEGKRVHPLTKIGYFLLTQGNRYANSFILLAGFALSGAFFVLGVNYVAPAFSYASRVNEALRQGIEFVSRDDALAAWQQAWLSVFLCLFCLGIMAFWEIIFPIAFQFFSDDFFIIGKFCSI